MSCFGAPDFSMHSIKQAKDFRNLQKRLITQVKKMKQQLLGGLVAVSLGMVVPLAAQAYPITVPPSNYRASSRPLDGKFCYATLTDNLYYCYEQALDPNRVSRTFGPNAIIVGPQGEEYKHSGFYSAKYRNSVYYGTHSTMVSPSN